MYTSFPFYVSREPSIHHQVNDLDLDATGDSNSAFPGVVAGKREAHGTSCAGIIAMEKSNNKCGVGVAYQSSITGTIRYKHHTLNSSARSSI